MIIIYRVLTFLLYPLLVLVIISRKFINKEDKLRYREKIFSTSFNVNRKKNSFLIWFHASSIGELKSILPIIRKLNKKNIEFLITTVTLSSSRIALDEFKKYKNIHHRFYPLDVRFLVRKFLNSWKPNAIFLVDSEIWPNLIFEARYQNIPIALLNARITNKTFRKWKIFPKTAKKIFKNFQMSLTSNLETKNYLEKLNAQNVVFNGNIKLVSENKNSQYKNLNKNFLIKKKLWLAASIHVGEEIFCIKTHLKIKEKFNDLITIIAPRHLDNIQKIKSKCEKLNLKVEVLNKDEKISKGKEIILINDFGVLQNYFEIVKSVFIGKSSLEKFKDVGGQNPIDAAKLGCKIYHGPYVYNFQDIYKFLEKNNISREVRSFDELSKNIIQDIENPNKNDNRNYNLINNLGNVTLKKTMKNVEKFLFNEII
tara:strand:- start:163 stop:1440 length:1278 start_codon:yes stop_codon:yes gene_type:complete